GRTDARAPGRADVRVARELLGVRAWLRRDRPPGGAGARGGAAPRRLRREDHRRRQRRHGRRAGRTAHARQRRSDRRSLRPRVGPWLRRLRRIVGRGARLRRPHGDVRRFSLTGHCASERGQMMQRGLRVIGLSGSLMFGVVSSAFVEEPASVESDSRHNTEEPKEAEQPVPVLTPAPTVVAPATVVAQPAAPKFGDLTTSGYLRGSFGASNRRGRMTCFRLALPGGMFSKYRLGNECEVWSETHFSFVTYAGDDGVVATLHVMPTVFIPTTYIGYSPNGATDAPDQNLTST